MSIYDDYNAINNSAESYTLANNIKNLNDNYTAKNAFFHSYASAILTYDYNKFLADSLGVGREIRSSIENIYELATLNKSVSAFLGEYRDESRDVYNNRVGQAVAEYALQNNLPVDAIADLIKVQIDSGSLIVDQFNDPRVGLNGIFGNESKFTPLTDQELQELRNKYGSSNGEHCFASGTIISGMVGRPIPIENIEIGDYVLAFDPQDYDASTSLSPRKVTRLFKSEATDVIDLHGVKVTPGHRFYLGNGAFEQIGRILESDGVIVRADGAVVRARTNQPIGREEDRVIPVAVDKEIVKLRAGVPYGRLSTDGPIHTLAAKMAHHGYRLRDDGLFENDAGDVRMASWEWGDPREHPVAKDYVVGEPYEIKAAPVN